MSKVTLICHFPSSGWPTWKLHHPFSGGKATSVDLSCFTRPSNSFFFTPALVNNLLVSRAIEGHLSSLLSQHKSHRNCFQFSLFLSSFSCSVPSNYKQSFSRLPVQFHRISISLFQDFAFLIILFLCGHFSSYSCPLFPQNCFQFFYINYFTFHRC